MAIHQKIMCYVITAMVKCTQITKNKYFTLDRLNTRLENMDLGYMEIKDRPTLISDATLTSSSTKLKQQGTCE